MNPFEGMETGSSAAIEALSSSPERVAKLLDFVYIWWKKKKEKERLQFELTSLAHFITDFQFTLSLALQPYVKIALVNGWPEAVAIPAAKSLLDVIKQWEIWKIAAALGVEDTKREKEIYDLMLIYYGKKFPHSVEDLVQEQIRELESKMMDEEKKDGDLQSTPDEKRETPRRSKLKHKLTPPFLRRQQEEVDQSKAVDQKGTKQLLLDLCNAIDFDVHRYELQYRLGDIGSITNSMLREFIANVPKNPLENMTSNDKGKQIDTTLEKNKPWNIK